MARKYNIDDSITTKRKPNWELLIFAIPFTIFSLYISYGFYLSFQEQQSASANFRPVKARILSSQVKTTLQSNVSGSNTKVHKPDVTYEYTIDGHTYQSKRFSYFDSAYNTTQEAGEVITRYPIGTTQTAYYNPNNLADSVLHKAMPTPWWNNFWFPALFLFAGFFSLFAGYKGWFGKQ